MRGRALIWGRVVDERKCPLQGVLVKTRDDELRTQADGRFEILIPVDRPTEVAINPMELTTAAAPDKRPEHLRNRCWRIVQVPPGIPTEGGNSWGDIVLGFPTAHLLCEVVDPSGRPFIAGSIKIRRGYSQMISETSLDVRGRAVFEYLDPMETITATVIMDGPARPDLSRIRTTWEFPPVAVSKKAVRFILEERLKRIQLLTL